MLKFFPVVARWEQTDDVLQNALVRLCRALEAAPPEDARHFYHLAELQIRRELLDLANRYRGPHGIGNSHHTDPAGEKLAGATDRGALVVQPSGGVHSDTWSRSLTRSGRCSGCCGTTD